jgi:hypothetical protein
LLRSIEVYPGTHVNYINGDRDRYKFVYSRDAQRTGALAILLNLNPLAKSVPTRLPVPKAGALLARGECLPLDSPAEWQLRRQPLEIESGRLPSVENGLSDVWR